MKRLSALALSALLVVGISWPSAAQSTFSGSVTSQIYYEDILDGPVTIDIVHPTSAKCIRAFSNEVGYPCETTIQVKASADMVITSLYVFDEAGESIGSIEITDGYALETYWQDATLYISEPEDSSNGTYYYTIGLDWYEDVISSNVTPIAVTWGAIPTLKAVGSKTTTLKNTKVFRSGSTITVNTNFKAPKDGCAIVPVKYRISYQAIETLYNHAIVIEDSKGKIAGSVVLRTEDDGYRGTAKVVVCPTRWELDEDTPRVAVKPGKYKISLWEWDDYYYSFGKSSSATLTFKN